MLSSYWWQPVQRGVGRKVFMFWMCFPANVGYTVPFLPSTTCHTRPKCYTDIRKTQLFDRMRGDCTHRYKTSHRLRTACAAYQEKTVMLVNGMVWNGGAWIVISAKVIHGPSWFFWEHAILGERNETDVAGLDGLTYIEFYHRPSDLFVWCWVMLSYIDDSLSRVGTEPQVVLHNHKLYIMCWFSSQQTLGTLCRFCRLPHATQDQSVTRISGKLNCLTGCEETAPTGTRQATDWGQHAQHIKKKLWC